MRKFLIGSLTVALTLVLIADVEAGWRRRARRCKVAVGAVQQPAIAQKSAYAFSGGPQQVAAQKAQRMANGLFMAHLGGSFGGASYEGVGVGSTASQALNNCCYSGQRVVAGQCAVQGRNGLWYACRLFW